LDFMLSRFTGLMEKLVIYPERMLQNLWMTHGVIFSQMAMLKLVEKGMSREDAYAVVQSHAMRSWEEDREFKELLEGDDRIRACLDTGEIDAIFRVENFLGHIDFIFSRVFGAQ
jgi:adenylosuccinate lyase